MREKNFTTLQASSTILKRNPSAEAMELLIWNYKNLSIVYYECEDINDLYSRLNELEVTKKWNARVLHGLLFH
ncbi:MAG: hypothetical protein M1409_07320 [Actinobacteria bacterium]|nr:hypothetical protein [Actinomycetota bacterium]